MADNSKNNFEVYEDHPDHHYRTELPNIIFEMGLSMEAFVLYSHLKKIAGDNGQCFKSVPHLAKDCGMGETKLRQSMKKLQEINLIKIIYRKNVDGSPSTNLITITPIWRLNGDIMRSRGEKKFSESKLGGGVVRAANQGGSCGEPGGSCGEGKEEHINKEPIEEFNDSAGKPASVNRFKKQKTSLMGLNEEQQQTLSWLQSLGLTTSEDTLSWWARNYSLSRLDEVYREALNRKADCVGAYMQRLLKDNTKVTTGRVAVNREYCTFFIQLNGWSSLKVTQKYATYRENNSDHEISFDMEPEQFQKFISTKYDSAFRGGV